MSEALEIALGTIGFTLAFASPFVVNKILKFKLEIAKIGMETEIKKEEIRAKNQFEIEKMIAQERKGCFDENQNEKIAGRINDNYFDSMNEKTKKEKIR